MKIGFLVLRDTYLKTMGTLIEECLRRQHEVLIFYQPDANKGEKAYQNVSPQTFPRFSGGEIQFAEYHPSDLEQLGDQHPIDVLVTHEGYHYFENAGLLENLAALRESGTPVVSLGHSTKLPANR